MKIEVKKKARRVFERVEFEEPTVRDCLTAVRISGKDEGLEYQAALLATIGIFDGKKLTMEDVLEMPQADFLALRDGFLASLAEQLDSATEKAL